MSSKAQRERIAGLSAGIVAFRRDPNIEPCVYCGVAANSIDHVPPREAREGILAAGLGRRYPFFEVHACRECNSVLGSRGLWTLTARREYIKRALRRRYAEFLRIPDWDDSELAQLEPTMRDYVLNGLAIRDFTRERITYAEPMVKRR